MRSSLLYVVVLLSAYVAAQDSLAAKTFDSKGVLSNEKFSTNLRNSSPVEFSIDARYLSQIHVSNKERKKHRRERTWKRKDNIGKCYHQKSRSQQLSGDAFKHILRNSEKTNLVRNKTIEILKTGLRILRTGENYTVVESKSPPRYNETLLERILSSAVSNQNIILSPTAVHKFPVGVKIYDRNPSLHVNETFAHYPPPEGNLDKEKSNRQNKKQIKVVSKDYEHNYDYEYEYDLIPDVSSKKSNHSFKMYENIHYKNINIDKNVAIMLKQIEKVFKNLTNCSNRSCFGKEKCLSHFEDSCQKWLNCKGIFHRVFPGDNHSLPSCPCIYPSTVFYDEMIWDKNQKKYFRWKDASNEGERLDIYKPGAAYCIRSLLTQGSLNVSAQQCCYDRSLRLLTRGSGAGTINFISPDVSRKLHYTMDILPWKLCKGDFTRYNSARQANNGNDCPENPNEEEYQLQVKLTKIF